jgi:predicted DNA binding protein
MTRSTSSRPLPISTTTSDAVTTRLILSADDFGIAELFERIPDAHVKFEPVVATPADHALLVVKVNDHDHDTIETALRRDPAIAMVEDFGKYENGWQYRVTWDGRTRELIHRITDAGVTLLDVQGQADSWKMRLLAPNRTAIRRADEVLLEEGCTPQYKAIRPLDSTRIRVPDLNQKHYETLVTAFEMGYYDIPRTTSLVELAEEFEISHQALSERFRRAHKQLIDTTSLED